jgi:hypothetical protein
MDRREATGTGDDNLLGLVLEGREKGEQGIKESMLLI